MSDIPTPPSPTNDQPPGPGYWKASDGNWYPPDAQPATATAPVAPTGPPMTPMAIAIPPGTQLTSLGKRLGGAILSVVLLIVTLVIGYVIWAAIAYGKGQTPAKQLLNMYVVDERTGQPATWGTMFIRGFLIDGVLGNVTFGIFSLVSTFWIFAGGTRQRLTDKMVHTIVVDAPNGLAA